MFFMATLWAMAITGWMSGAVFDFTDSYQAAFVNVLLGRPSPS